MTARPPLLKTYADARFLWEARGWGIDGVGIELGENPELKRFKISQPTLSRKTRPGSSVPIEPEVAAAVEALKTRPGYERQAEIAMRGLLALHGATRGEDVGQLVKEMRECLPGEIALKVIEALEKKAGARDRKLIDALDEKASAREGRLIDALEEKAGARESRLLQAVAKLGQLTWGHVAVAAAGTGALVVAVALAPLLARAVMPPVQHIFIVARAGGGPALWAEAESYLVLSRWGETRPLDQEVPKQTLPHQKVAPCDAGLGEVSIYGNCWGAMADVKPPCGRIFRYGDKCYRPVAADPAKQLEPGL